MTKPQRATIRKQELQDFMNPALAALMDEVGQRATTLITRYHALHVIPLEYEVRWLATPWYKRLFLKKPTPPEVVAEVKKPEPVVAEEPDAGLFVG